ncbi:Kiwa anti-phage protein KwaB-like domain-containing protein [Conexibacter sp. W3-3-2]|uniref:Kiwa anti-phage protein KwaB-like domain-containing protein n=1 Tax=Conexibacter sp. W3-3-2 TaxID=2675227 RepID=UPI0018AA3FA4|nr:Kiwa anti-phage protein KwaB-like domain-containing protein [Conexibacter sp. W3-3-2]
MVVALNEDDVVTNLAMAWRSSPPHYDVQRVDIAQDVASQFLTLARDTAGELTRSSEVTYDPEWPLKHHEHFELTGGEIPAPKLFDDLRDLLNQPRLTKNLLTKPRLYAVAVQTSKGIALFGRRMAYLKVLGRQRSIFAAVWDGDTFNKLDKSVATFANSFDWVLWDGTLSVLDSAGFHAEFRDNKAIRARVAEHVKAITKVLAIQNADKFIERCQSSVPMASKLEKVANDGIWKEPVAQLKTYATRMSRSPWNFSAAVR